MRPITDAERAKAQRECDHVLRMSIRVGNVDNKYEEYCGACWLTSGRCATEAAAHEKFEALAVAAKA